jgi:hypothetical protein
VNRGESPGTLHGGSLEIDLDHPIKEGHVSRDHPLREIENREFGSPVDKRSGSRIDKSRRE